MFSNVLFFILVFSLYAFYEPRDVTVLAPRETALTVLFIYFAFYWCVRLMFSRLEKIIIRGGAGPFSTLHSRLINRCTAVAVLVYAFFIYGLDIRSLLTATGLPISSELLQGIFAVAVFFILLIIIWLSSYPSYKQFYNPTTTLKAYLVSHGRLTCSIFAPWFMFAAVLDAFKMLPDYITGTFGGNPAASYVFMGLVFIAVGALFPTLLVRLWGCAPIPDGALRTRLEDFCKNKKFTCSNMMEWNLFDGKLITAGVVGFVPRFRYLLISPALLDMLSDDELEAVVAHEIGHVRCRHMLFYLLFMLGYAFFSYVFFSAFMYLLLSQDFVFDLLIGSSGKPGSAFSFSSMALLVVFLLLYFRLLFGFFSRNFERQADGCAIKYTGTGEGIIRSLEKIASAGAQSRTAPNWHHFSIQERIDYMQACEQNPSQIARHDHRVARSIGLYCAAFIFLAAVFFAYGRTFVGESELSILIKIAERRLAAEPKNEILHFLLGNIYYEQKRYDKAEKSYLVSLALKPDNAEALNNLAWLYATCEEPSLRKPAEALRFAVKAATLLPAPHILDTLAESYFVNGDFLMAVVTIRKAIEMNPPDPDYFQRQLKKFQQHLDAEQDIEQNDAGGDDRETGGIAI